MSVAPTTGVAVLARLLRQLGEGRPMTVAEFAAAEGFARSTVFDISRRMEDAGLLRRDGSGNMQAGPAAAAYALSRYGIGALHGPAEALLTQLRDETQASVRLVADDGTVLLSLTARRADAGPALEATITERVTLSVAPRANITRAERDDTQMRLSRTVTSLRHYLSDGDSDG